MLRRLTLRTTLLAVVIGLTAWIVPGIHVEGGFIWLLWIALIFSAINTIIGPIARLLTLPLIALTLGLFLLIINAGLLALTAWLSDHLNIDNLTSAIIGGLLISIFSTLGELLLPIHRPHTHTP